MADLETNPPANTYTCPVDNTRYETPEYSSDINFEFEPEETNYFLNSKGFIVSSNSYMSGLEYVGNVLPEGFDRYRVLENINGKYYHKNTYNPLAALGNKLGLGNFVEKKAYDPAAESFMEETMWTLAGIGLGKAASKIGGKVLEAFSKAGKRVWSMPWLERGAVIEQWLGKNLPGNFPVIDKFVGGVATSIKSMNLGLKTFSDIFNTSNNQSFRYFYLLFLAVFWRNILNKLKYHTRISNSK